MDRIGVELSDSPGPPVNDTSAGAVAESLAWTASSSPTSVTWELLGGRPVAQGLMGPLAVVEVEVAAAAASDRATFLQMFRNFLVARTFGTDAKFLKQTTLLEQRLLG